MLPFADEVRLPDYRFYESIIRVVKPFQKRRNPNPAIPLDVPFVLTAMPGKVMCSLAGLEQVKRGNHRVEHKRGPAVRTSKLLVYHYPVRRLEKFIRKIRFAKERFALEANPPPRHSHQWRRWAAQDGLGLLTPEWQSMSLDRKQFVRLEADGIVRRDNTMFRYFNRRQSD
jgi:hypothetical protein